MHRKWTLAAICLACTLPLVSFAAGEPTGESESAPKIVRRLPNHYSKLVDDSQRKKIYAIQSKYAEQIETLQEQLKELMLERDAEIRAVLSAEQQKKLDELLSAVKSRAMARRRAAAERAESNTAEAAATESGAKESDGNGSVSAKPAAKK